MFTEMCSLMAITYVPAMLSNQYFIMITSHNLPESTEDFAILLEDYSACATAS